MRALRFVSVVALFALLLFCGARAFAQPSTEPPREVKLDPITEDSDEEAHAGDSHAKHNPQKITLGIEIAGLTKFELGPGSFNAELFVTIDCEREPCKPELDVTNGKITGTEKLVDEKLHKELKIKAELSGFVDLAEYPFDRHVLPIAFVDKHDPLDVVLVLDQKESKIDSDVKLAGWTIEGWEAHTDKHEVSPGIYIYEIEFGAEITRPRLAAIFKTFVPAFFMIFVMGFTLLLKPKSAAGRLTAATGALMTVVMFHLSSTSSLPPLGYLTRLDKFMIAAYVVYLVNILASVAIVRFDEAKNEKYATWTYLLAGGAVPGLALCAFLMVFFRLV